jgi:cytochrome oxidase Cu insertion factor (SCO1/SenC/PrrC family)
MRRYLMVSFLIAVFLFWDIPIVSAQFSEAGVQAFRIPVDAPDFTLNSLGGGEVSLGEFKGKIVILNFFTTW